MRGSSGPHHCKSGLAGSAIFHGMPTQMAGGTCRACFFLVVRPCKLCLGHKLPLGHSADACSSGKPGPDGGMEARLKKVLSCENKLDGNYSGFACVREAMDRNIMDLETELGWKFDNPPIVFTR